MSGAQEDFSVMAYHALGATMASQDIALTMAEMIFKDVFGEDNFKTQLPLKLADGGDRWIIEGSRNAEDYTVPEGEFHDGPALIEILKANCQVLKLTQLAY
jgi:hypothetical protein